MFFQSKTFIKELMPLTPIDSQEIWLALNKTWERTIHWAFTPFFNIFCSSNSMKDLEGSLSISFAYCSFTVTYENILNVFFFSCMGLSSIFGPLVQQWSPSFDNSNALEPLFNLTTILWVLIWLLNVLKMSIGFKSQHKHIYPYKMTLSHDWRATILRVIIRSFHIFSSSQWWVGRKAEKN